MKLNITIDLGGQTEIKVEGVAGPGCSNLTKQIEAALGTVTSDKKTPEFHQQSKQTQQAKAGQ